ncbi:MAG: macro domain-containing protein [Eubacterium sp.]|nr:macro domain-containing protein [Candidatus Colimonas fimequi]
MSSINIKKQDITTMHIDCIVNAANSGLRAGGGVCGAIFRKAGHEKLQAACNAIGGCPTGEAVITPGFDLPAKYIIHAVGPIWQGGNNGEQMDLYNAYRSSLMRAMENECHSIAFPLISSGIYGYPKEEAWEEAIMSCSDFLDMCSYYDMEVFFCVIDDIGFAMGNKIAERILGDEGEAFEEEFPSAVINNVFSNEEDDNPYVDGCPALEEALTKWHANDFDDEPDAVLDVLFEELKGGLKVIVPIKYENQGTDEEDVLFQIIETDEGVNLLACFTNNREKAKGEASSADVIPMVELMQKAVEIEGCSGVAINPWGDGILVPQEIVEAMLNDLQPKTQDQIDTLNAIELYHRGEYAEAFMLLQSAAADHNITAVSWLGNCFYFGNGTMPDFNKAKACWDKAALLNDINATIMIADLYRSGEIEKDEEFAVALYGKAFMMACENRDIWTFPEAAISMLTYCTDMVDPEDIAAIASDVEEALYKRINLGDDNALLMLNDVRSFG